MGSRKEHIKKTLGITEYPWSSDDDDQPMPDVHLLRRQAAEPRPSVADMPGTSGQPAPSSPTLSPAKRNQGSQAELFWSMMQPNKSTSSGASRSRACDSTRPPAHAHAPAAELRERPERTSAAADIQRILAFKKLTRSLGSMRPNRTNSSLYSMSSRGLTGPSRNPIFTPAMSAEVAASLKSSRVHSALKRLQASRNTLPTYSTGNRVCANLSASDCRNYDLLAPSSGYTAPTPPVRSEPINLDEPIYLTTNDRISSPHDNIPVVPARDENIVTIEGTIVDTTHNTSGAMSLEEEIVEIDAHDETDNNASADAAESPIVNADVGLNEVVTLDASAEAQRLRQERNRRDGSDDAEPVTVKEFNQNLLRLLECPVCLEWMEPPMSQCRRGHLVCGRCRARLASCPVCRTTFSSVRNRAMEGVAEMVRYPCRHSCGREVRLRRRGAHEASCSARRYACPAPACAERPPLPRDHLAAHFQTKHTSMLKMGRSHKFSLKVNSEQHDTWVVGALHEYFSLRVDVDIRTWGVIVLVAYIGPKCNASNYTYEVSVVGQHNSRKLVYARATHSDLESSSLNVSRQDCFHLTLDQALNFLRVKNRHCEPDKFLDFNVEISKCETERDDSDS